MAKPGDNVTIVDSETSISPSNSEVKGEQSVMYGDGLARGGSNTPRAGDTGLLTSPDTIQGAFGTPAQVTIRDSNGESTGEVSLITRDMTIEDYCGYGSEGNASVSGPISDEMLELGVTSFLVYENSSTKDRSFGFFHDEYISGGGQDGDIQWGVTGLPDSATTAVEDDPDSNSDVYDLANGVITHQWWDPNTDGVALGTFTKQDLVGVETTFAVTKYAGNQPPTKVRFIGDNGTTVERPYDGTNTEVTIRFRD